MRAEAILVWLLLFAAHAALLWTSGAFQAEFGEYPDEPAHYVTGLMVRDYLAAGASSPPMAFAGNYYLHYPKVALGHYPPLFCIVETVWMLAFSSSRASLLVLVAVLTAIAATVLHFVVRERYGSLAGVMAGLLLIATPLVQRYCGMVMPEALCMLFIVSAALCYCRYLETKRWPDAAWFGLLASLALLTKQVALFLALVPLIAVILTRQFGLLRRPSFWLPACIVLAIAAPWYGYAHSLLPGRILDYAGQVLGHLSLGDQVLQLLRWVGLGLLLPMAAGVWTHVIRPILRAQPVQPAWAVWAALIVAFLLSRPVMPAAYESRHLIYLLPAILFFAVDGIASLAAKLPPARWKPGKRAALLALAAGLAFGVETFKIPQRRYIGFSEAAEDLVASAELRTSVLLVCSDSQGEGAFIAAVAAREKRPGHLVLRGSKMLARTTWSGDVYALRYKTVDELAAYLQSVPVDVLVVEVSGGQPQMEHRKLVQSMLDSGADRWKLNGTYPKKRSSSPPGAEVRVYCRTGGGLLPAGKIHIKVRHPLGDVSSSEP